MAGAGAAARRAAERIGVGVAAPAADDVDRRARFPAEAVAALRAEGLLGAAAPRAFGGLGLNLRELADVAQLLAQGCASTAMVWAMHQIQVACLARHGLGAPFFEAYLREVAERQPLIASVTSEVGVGGDIRTSIAAVEQHGGAYRLEKHGATVSYGAQADAFLVTARARPQAAGSDQVFVLLRRDGAALEQTGAWDTLGMRGTCSPAFRIAATLAPEQVLPVPFAEICARTLVPVSHVLWSACWLGIATDAVRRAGRSVRDRARRAAGAPGGDPRLADAAGLLQQLRAGIQLAAGAYDGLRAAGDDDGLSGLGFAIEMNQLKVASSELVVQIVGQALAICGMAGYAAGGPHSVGRHLRDAYSAGCMISNERLRLASATMLLAHKGDFGALAMEPAAPNR
jgi:acyl-CoA dehydrogenase